MKFVDIDGHILEPSDLWINNLEPQYRGRAMRFVEDDQGLESWTIDGEVHGKLVSSTSANLATIGKSAEWRRENIFQNHTVSWEDGRAMAPGACDPHERIKLMDKEGIDVSFLFPSLGLSWPGRVRDRGLAAAYCRVYNDWMADFCHHYPQRLLPCFLLPWTEVDDCVEELKRTADLGPRAVMVPSSPPRDIAYGKGYWDPLWAEFQEQDTPLSLHPGSGGTSGTSILYPELMMPSWWTFTANGVDVLLGFLSFFQEAAFDRFPQLKMLVLESGCAWMPWLLQRMDEKHQVLSFTTPMKLKPSEYFYRQCWIDMDPDDELGPVIINLLGADKVMWAYDYPHSDSPVDPVVNLVKTLECLPEEDLRKVAGENAINLYHLPMSE
ncbi:MAG: amidohydrolase family protein [Dehalococcoidia bacterium]